jgi:DNA-binding IclR family transcriptional regulator
LGNGSRGPQRANRRSLAPIGLDVLSVLARHPEGMGITDLARSIGFEVAQAHRTVRELVNEGWVDQGEPNGRYGLTGSLLALAAEQLRRMDLREVALPVLRRLKQQTGETILLAEYRGGRLICTARELSEGPVVAWTQMGESWSLGSPAAVSIAIEAAIVASGQSELFPLDYAPPEDRLPVLRAATARGWAYDPGLYRGLGCAVASSVSDLESRPVGAIAIAWPCDPGRSTQAEELGQIARHAAAEISGRLGLRQGDLGAPWRAIAESREEDLMRHLADLRAVAYEGAVGRDAQQRTFQEAARLLEPVVEEILGELNDRLLLGSGTISKTEAESQADGAAVSWSLSWPDQRAAIVRASGMPLEPVSVVARLRPSHIHGHLGGSYFGDWPMQIVSADDARRQAPVVLAIAEAELHQRIFDAGGNWRLVPAYCERIGEAGLAEPESVSGGSA